MASAIVWRSEQYRRGRFGSPDTLYVIFEAASDDGTKPLWGQALVVTSAFDEEIMNWDMLAAIGEIIGAGAVVLTLGYLALQVRESARQDRRQQSRAMQEHFASLLNLLVGDEELASLFLTGISDFEGLGEVERFRFGAWMVNVLRSQEQLLHFQREGGILGYQEGSLTPALREVMMTPGARKYWETRREWFSPEFQEEVDGWIAEGGRDYRVPGVDGGMDR